MRHTIAAAALLLGLFVAACDPPMKSQPEPAAQTPEASARPQPPIKAESEPAAQAPQAAANPPGKPRPEPAAQTPEAPARPQPPMTVKSEPTANQATEAAADAPTKAQLEPTVTATEGPAKLQPRTYFSPGEEVEGHNLEGWAERLRHADDSVREKAISIIPLYGSAASYLVPDLVKRLDPKFELYFEDLGPRVKAIMALGVMEIQSEHVPMVVSAMAKTLREDPQHAAKLQAALTLTRFGPEEPGKEARKEAIGALAGAANDKGSWQIRKAAILALRRIGSDAKNGPDPVATRALMQLVRFEKTYYVKLEAVQALGYMDKPAIPELHKSVLAALEAVAADRTNKVMPMWAHVSIMALDKVTDERIKQITKNLDSPELEVRGQAVLALGTLGMKAKPCVSDLVRMLDDKDNGIVVVSCWALVSVGERDPKAIAAMEDLLKRKDLDERVREQVARALDELKNHPKSELFPSAPTTKDEPKKEKEKEFGRRDGGRP
jgi:HEAT repeat protein